VSHKTGNRMEELEAALPPIVLPRARKLTPEELERRRQQLIRAREIRAAILAECGPLGMNSGELKHLARQEAEG
jgi:hypothetical protein